MIAFIWSCQCEDNRRGCFNPDYDGRCEAKSKKPLKTYTAARNGADKHEMFCQLKHYGQGVAIFQVTLDKRTKLGYKNITRIW